MASATIERPMLRLVTSAGRSVKREAKPAGRLSDVEAYEQVIAATTDARSRLDPSSGAWRELSYLLIELERSVVLLEGSGA